jgi:hypothetical protein
MNRSPTIAHAGVVLFMAQASTITPLPTSSKPAVHTGAQHDRAPVGDLLWIGAHDLQHIDIALYPSPPEKPAAPSNRGPDPLT